MPLFFTFHSRRSFCIILIISRFIICKQAIPDFQM